MSLAPRKVASDNYLHDRPAVAPGIIDEKQRSVKDATCAKPELIAAGTSKENN